MGVIASSWLKVLLLLVSVSPPWAEEELQKGFISPTWDPFRGVEWLWREPGWLA